MLTANQGSLLASKAGTIKALLVAPNVHIYTGALIVIRQTTGFAYPAMDDTSDTYKQVVYGYALEEVNTLPSQEFPTGCTTREVRVRRDVRKRTLFLGTPTQTCIGKLALVKADDTVQLFASGQCKIVVGRIDEIDADSVYVDLADRPYRISTDAND